MCCFSLIDVTKMCKDDLQWRRVSLVVLITSYFYHDDVFFLVFLILFFSRTIEKCRCDPRRNFPKLIFHWHNLFSSITQIRLDSDLHFFHITKILPRREIDNIKELGKKKNLIEKFNSSNVSWRVNKNSIKNSSPLNFIPHKKSNDSKRVVKILFLNKNCWNERCRKVHKISNEEKKIKLINLATNQLNKINSKSFSLGNVWFLLTVWCE